MLNTPPIQTPTRSTATTLGGSDAAQRTSAVAPVQRVPAPERAAGTARAYDQATRGGPRSTLANALREPGLQQQLGALQQGQDYLERLGASLQQLKSGLSQQLARPQGEGAALQPQLESLRQLWAQRAAEAGGQLDARLLPAPEGESARQRFRLRGLDMNSLASEGSETLRLSLPGQPRPLLVPLDGRGLQPALQSLQRALAPTGLRVETQGGELQFSVEESAWPALREGLALRGDGKRFPSGQMVRAMLDPAPEALTPQGWTLDGPEAQRRSLVQVLDAQARVQRARQALGQRLDQARKLGDSTGAAEDRAQAVHRFAAEFARSPRLPAMDYGRLSALAPAVQGLHRQQVQQLLLPPEAAASL